VIVGTSSHSAGKALLLGFGFPLLLLLVVIGVLFAAGVNEGITALAALVALIPYYIGLWIFRQRIADNIAFFIQDV
jgi:sigma-E factor negative regulatory protein RseC